MKQLFDHIKQSIYGPAYYQALLTRPFSFSLKYYLALVLSIALFLTIISSIPLVPKMNQFVRDFPAKFFAYYPDPLEVRIDKGIVSTNVAEPYFLPAPETLKNDATRSLVVIDTKTPFSVAQFEAYQSDIWLGKEQITLADGDNIRIESFDTEMNLMVNETQLKSFEQKLQPFYKFVAPVVVTAIFLGLLVAFCVNFVYLLLGAILIFFLGRLLKQHWSYGTAYRIGLHASTLPLVLSAFLSMLELPFLNFPLFYSAVMLFVVYMNFKGVAPATPLAPTS